jgi:phosphatidylserine/phosphatidylglycerophosphate/cardiolipin synthase-like enzyme
MRHMSNLIVRAEKEVILATNYWQNSVASKYITNAMRELSKRAGARGERIVFKLEYDRGSPKQLLNNHMDVPEKGQLDKAVNLPAKEDIPYIDLQVINYHKPMLGTFHCKYMVVDRKYAVLQSNNIQDNDNMEMMTHLEGPIVDSLYDMALISWNNKLEPPLPSHNSPAVQGGITTSNESQKSMFIQHGTHIGFPAQKGQERAAYGYEARAVNQPGAINGGTSAKILTGPSTTESVVRPVNSNQNVIDGEQHVHYPGEVNTSRDPSNQDAKDFSVPPPEHSQSGFEEQDLARTEVLKENVRAAGTTGDVEHIAHDSGKDASPDSTTNDVSNHTTKGTAYVDRTKNTQGANGPDSATEQFLNSGDQALPQSQISNPSQSCDLLPEHTTDDPHYDDDIAGEVARVQTAVSPKGSETRVEAVTRHLNHTRNAGFKGNAPECEEGEEMTPYIPHPVHQPFPIAMVCREPYGTPNHNSVYNPQNEVWLSALKNAKKNVFIQSPTLNAEPLVPAIIEACERGIDVYCYICLGYNDTVSPLFHRKLHF